MLSFDFRLFFNLRHISLVANVSCILIFNSIKLYDINTSVKFAYDLMQFYSCKLKSVPGISHYTHEKVFNRPLPNYYLL